MDAQTQEKLKRIENHLKWDDVRSADIKFLLQFVRKQKTQLSTIKDQFQIAVEHWEMYEDQFVDVEQEAYEKARQTLEEISNGNA